MVPTVETVAYCLSPWRAGMSPAEPKERIHFRSKVEAIDKSADGQRDFDAFVVSAKGETSTKRFQDWAGGEQVTLTIVFTGLAALAAGPDPLAAEGHWAGNGLGQRRVVHRAGRSQSRRSALRPATSRRVGRSQIGRAPGRSS